MRLLEVDRSAAIAWSNLPNNSGLVAAGTIAGTLDIDFDTSAHLEIFQLDLSKKTSTVLGKTSATDRFNKLAWGLTGTVSQTYSKGILAGGLANGTVTLWDPVKIISGEGDAQIAVCEKHTSGPVQGLDFNPFQHNLLASGASDSEILIWDLQNPSEPTVYNPGAKSNTQSIDNPITVVNWNKKVQHILASTNYSGVTVVWDLKAKRAVLNFSHPNNKLRCRAMAWNPEEATQLVTASEDDASPLIEIWDLRNSYAPVKTLQGHTAGVWGISWCPYDNDLLLSCGKDNKTICWNLKTGDVLCEVDINSQRWNFDVQWSPKVPAILSTCSLEGKIRVYSLQDVRTEVQNDKSLGEIATNQSTPKPNYTTPPKWLKRPVGVTFGFGGKLLYFNNKKNATKKTIQVNQIITDNELLERADKLDEALATDSLKQYCDQKIAVSNTQDKAIWGLLKVLLEDTQRSKILYYLGYDNAKINQEIAKFTAKLNAKSFESPKVTKKEKVKPTIEIPEKSEIENVTTTTENADEVNAETKTDKKDMSGLFLSESAEASVFDNLEVQEKELATTKPEEETETTTTTTPIIAKKEYKPIEFNFDPEEDIITNALLVGNFEGAVDCCIQANRMTDALILAAYGGPSLWNKTQEIYLRQQQNPFHRVISAIMKNELRELVEQTELTHWKATLAILCTYAKREDFPLLCALLGDRLLVGNDSKSASLCYICAGNIEKTLQIWTPTLSTDDSIKSSKSETAVTSSQNQNEALQGLIEKISVFRKAISHKDPLAPSLAKKYSEYAELLASQGRINSAIKCLTFVDTKSNDDTFTLILLDRLYHYQRNSTIAQPPFPFKREEVGPTSVVPQKQVQQQPQQIQNQQVYQPYNTQQQPNRMQPQQQPLQPHQQILQQPIQANTHMHPNQQQRQGQSSIQQTFPHQNQPFSQSPLIQQQSLQQHPPLLPKPQSNIQPMIPQSTQPLQPLQTLQPQQNQPPLQPQPYNTGVQSSNVTAVIPPQNRNASSVGLPTPPTHQPQVHGHSHGQSGHSHGHPHGPGVTHSHPPTSQPPLSHPVSQPHTQPPPTHTHNVMPPTSLPTPGTSSTGPTTLPTKSNPPPLVSQPTPPGTKPPTPTTTTTTATTTPTSPTTSSGPTSQENQFIIDLLKQILAQCEKSTDPKVTKLVKDVQKRCEPMIVQLSKNEFSPQVTQSLSQLLQSITSGDHKSAQSIHIELTQKHWEELGSNLMIAIKRLVEMTKSQ